LKQRNVEEIPSPNMLDWWFEALEHDEHAKILSIQQGYLRWIWD
jgi:hypothetical protein